VRFDDRFLNLFPTRYDFLPKAIQKEEVNFPLKEGIGCSDEVTKHSPKVVSKEEVDEGPRAKV